MSEVRAPDLCGLAPDEAHRVCYGEDLWLTVIVSDMVEVSGWDSSRVRVAKQWPSPGGQMDSRSVTVCVDILDGGDEAGVREPRRPSPVLRAPAVEPGDAPTLGVDDHRSTPRPKRL
jgi:hypothetical protein